MNPLKLRLQVFACIVLALAAHAFATDGAANDPEGMFIYHFSGAFMDAMLCMVVTFALVGRRGLIMHDLMLASVVVNVLGWVLYMGYVDPIYYNVTMWSLSAAQFLCLFLPGEACQKWMAKASGMKRFVTWGVRDARAS